MEGLELINLMALLIWIHVSVMWNILENNVSKYKGIMCVCVCCNVNVHRFFKNSGWKWNGDLICMWY
jgi:hypothetical protein